MTTSKPDRLSVMVPRDCKGDIDYIMSQTGIKSNGELFKLLLTRYKDDFVSAYNQFFLPSATVQPQPPIEIVASSPPTETNKPLTSAISF